MTPDLSFAMKNFKNYLIVALSILLAISLFANPAQSAPTPKFLTKAEFKKFSGLIVIEIAKQSGQITSLANCVNSLEVQLGGNGREVNC